MLNVFVEGNEADMVKVAICEDESKDRDRLIHLLQDYKEEYEMDMSIDIYANGEVLISKFNNQYHVIFMDVILGGLDGIKTAKQIRKSDPSVAIIYATHHNTNAINCYSVDASDYLMKPVTYVHLKRALMKATPYIRQKKYSMLINNKNSAFELSLYDVLYVEYELRTLKIHKVTGETIAMKGTLKSVLEVDKGELMVKINKYQLVNRIWLDKCEEGKVYLKDGRSSLCVSRERWKEVKDIYIRDFHMRNS
jgi:DNA-binding LytR/AlgR family response regulator